MSFERPGRWVVPNDGRQTEFAVLSIVVPVFDEQESIAGFIAAVDAAIGLDVRTNDSVSIEYMFVNDGSRDNTELVIRAIAARDPRVVLVNLSRNFGKEAALSAGLRHARGNAVIPMDVDLQDPPELVPEMVELWRQGAKVVNAQRVDRSSDTRFKRITSAAFYRLINRLSDFDIPRDVGDFRLLDREAVDVVNQLTEHGRFNKGLFSWIGFKVATVEYARPVRAAGTTKWNVRKLALLAIDGLTASTTLPLRIWTGVGLAIAAGAFAYAMWLIGYTWIFGVDTPGYASLMVITLALGGLNFISLGVMGEYVGRIAVQVRARPLYIVDSVVEHGNGA